MDLVKGFGIFIAVLFVAVFLYPFMASFLVLPTGDSGSDLLFALSPLILIGFLVMNR